MKKLMLFCALSVPLIANSQIASANSNLENLYFGIGGSFLNIEVDGTKYIDLGPSSSTFSYDVDDASVLGAFIGFQFNPWVSLETRGYFGLTDGDRPASVGGGDVKIKKYFALYARPTLPIHENFSLYGLFGYGVGTLRLFDQSETESDFTYGLGMEISKGTNVKLQIEWTQLHDDNYTYHHSSFERDRYNVDISGINANIVWYF